MPIISLCLHIFPLCQITWVMGESVSLIFCKMALEAEPVSLGWSKDCKVITWRCGWPSEPCPSSVHYQHLSPAGWLSTVLLDPNVFLRI